MENETKTHKYRLRLRDLEEQAADWRAMWRDIADYMSPMDGKYLLGEDKDTKEGKNTYEKIINGTATDSIDILAAGMMGGLTPASVPWFRLTLSDIELATYDPVKKWLYDVQNLMYNIFSRSNFYSAVHALYSELGSFGTSAMNIEEDFDNVIRCRPFTIGEYYIALDASYRASALFRKCSYSVSQLVEKFGVDSVSDRVKNDFDNKRLDRRHEVCHVIQPNTLYNSNFKSAKGMEYESVYFEKMGDPDKILRRSGYREKPFVCPRWKVKGVNTYGNSRAMDALGDVKMLQKIEEKKLKSLDKMVDPPMNAPTSLRKKGGNIVAGGVNYIDRQSGSQGFEPAYLVRPDMQNIAYEIDRVERRIRRFFFNDLFLSIINEDKRMTATEVVQRHSEKLVMLGPVLERLQAELLDPTITRVYGIASNLGLLPPPPEEIQGLELKIEYVSLLAQAQQVVSITPIEQTAAFIGNLAGIKPEVLDKFDADEAVNIYADKLGLPPDIIVSAEKVAEIRAQRAQQLQAQQMQESLANVTQGAKVLSDTELDKNSALDGLLGSI